MSYVASLARHHHADPELFREEQVRDFFLFLRTERHCAGSSMALTLPALRRFYGESRAVTGETKDHAPSSVRAFICLFCAVPLRLVALRDHKGVL